MHSHDGHTHDGRTQPTTNVGMARHSRFRRLAVVTATAAAGVAIAVGTAGCGAGQISQTANQLPAVNGALGNLGQLELRNVQIINPTGDAAKTYAAGGPFQLSFLINNSSAVDTFRLVGVKAPKGSVNVSGDVTVSPGQSVRVGKPAAVLQASTPDAEQGQSGMQQMPTATLTNASSTVSPGLMTDFTFVFAKVDGSNSQPAGEVTIETPVDTGTLATRVDRPREAEQPEDENSGHEQLPGE